MKINTYRGKQVNIRPFKRISFVTFKVLQKKIIKSYLQSHKRQDDKNSTHQGSYRDTELISRWMRPICPYHQLNQAETQPKKTRSSDDKKECYKNICTHMHKTPKQAKRFFKITCHDNLMSHVDSHSNHIGTTCEHNIRSFWITKNLHKKIVGDI